MSITASVPLRGGSKSIIDKNIRIFCGKPLVFWVLNASLPRIHVLTVYDKFMMITIKIDYSLECRLEH